MINSEIALLNSLHTFKGTVRQSLSVNRPLEWWILESIVELSPCLFYVAIGKVSVWERYNLPHDFQTQYKAESMLAPNQWETSLQSNAVSHWFGANLESVLQYLIGHIAWQLFPPPLHMCHLLLSRVTAIHLKFGQPRTKPACQRSSNALQWPG